ncbi:MAG TPA: hypothetical protein VGM54_25950 [Chthoniobacter sp.]|jgi:hypothetical protein
MIADLYLTTLTIHSYLRWLVVIAAVAAVICAFLGLIRNRSFKSGGRKFGAIYTGLLDLQLLIGIYLYATSPIVRVALANMAVAMKQKELRFFAVEHLTTMLITVVLAHVGSIRSKRAPNDKTAYSRALFWYLASTIVLFLGIPWWRPLLRPWGGG